MLEHVPAWLGKAMAGMRAGADALAIARPELGGRFAALRLSSPAFGDGARMPERFTADGAGVSPPLTWGSPPEGTASLALLVEDADAPARQPLVHAIVWGLAPDAGMLAEGAIASGGPGDAEVGRNSFFRQGWLPPDPPAGHGEHRYAFQLFALEAGVGDPGEVPGRGSIVEAMSGHVLAAGLLVGTYSREESAPIGPVGAAALP
jgi:hypothetical protein